jgi:SpoVK/Ycf46/Vps4 family AAA+-type ATPase
MCFINYIRAGYPILWIKSHEEARVLTEYALQISKLKVPDGEKKYQAFAWDVADGVRSIGFKNGALASGESVEGTAGDPLQPLLWLDKTAEENSILFLKDYNPFLQKEFQDSVLLSRKLRNLISKFKSQGKVLVLLSADAKIPVELDKEISVLDYKLPNREDLRIVLKASCESSGAPYPENEDDLIDAALGMTAFEAENAFSISLVESKKFDPKVVRREKSATVKKTGLLEVIESNYTMDDIGGLENLKGWLGVRKNCFGAHAKEFGITPPKGLLLAGVPGTGKSLSAKAVSTVWNRPLLRFDMGRIMGGIVGESEGNMRKCLDIAGAVAPCVLWIDEIEKGLSGVKAGANQQKAHEVTERVFGELLNFMQDRQADVFLVATCNSLESLPPELLRSGRIDCIFWVDLPDAIQREEIIKIHLKRRGREPNMFDADMPKLLKATEGFTGAEIEVWIQESLVRAFSQNHKELQLNDLLETAPEITPISKLMKSDIENSRKAAEARGTKLASAVHQEVKENETSKPRKVSLI